MADISYETAGGIERVVRDVVFLERRSGAAIYLAGNGKKYYWFDRSVIDGRLTDDVLEVETRGRMASGYCRRLGARASYIK